MKKFRLVLGVLITLLVVLGVTPVTGSQYFPELPKTDNEITGLSLVGHLDTPGSVNAIKVQGDYAYICDSSSLRIVNVSDPSVPAEVGSYAVGCADLKIAGNYAYLASDPSSSLKIFDVSDPSSPALVGNLSSEGWWGTCIDVQGGIAYLGEAINETHYRFHIALVDVSDPNSPFLIGTRESGFTIDLYDVDVAGNYVYIANSHSGLRIFSSDPYNFAEVGLFDSASYSMGVTVVGDLVFLSEGDGMRIVDVSDPEGPSLVSFFAASGYQKSAVASGIAYVASASYGVAMLDVTDPANPHIAGAYNTPGYAVDVAEANGYVYVADGSNGLVILLSSFKITGIVSDPFGGLMSDVTVTATGGYSTMTDENGVYLFNNMPPGMYTVTPAKEGFAFSPVNRSVTIPPNAYGADFTGVIYLYIPMVIR